MALSRLQQRLIWIAVAVALVACVPAMAGYAWAIVWLPVYGTVCHVDKVFGSTIDPDGYRVYLLDRGCDIDAAIRQIVEATPNLSVDPSRIVAIQHGTLRADSADEFLAADLLQTKLRRFPDADSGNGCTPDGYCTIPDSSADDPIRNAPHAYSAYVRSQFLYALDDGADYVTSLLRMGVVVQVVMALCYAAAMLAVVKCVVNFMDARFRRR